MPRVVALIRMKDICFNFFIADEYIAAESKKIPTKAEPFLWVFFYISFIFLYKASPIFSITPTTKAFPIKKALLDSDTNPSSLV